MANNAQNDIYRDLELKKPATQKDIRSAYRRLSLKYHPDKNPGGKDDFIRITHAYEILGDEKKKKKYDKLGIHSDPSKDSNNEDDKLQKHKESFDTYWASVEKEIDSEIDDLLNWWTSSQRDDTSPHIALRIDSGDFYQQLLAVFEQYRLTHPATSGDEERGRKAGAAILNFTGNHFGKANQKVLQDWNGDDALEPAIGGKYTDKDGTKKSVPPGPVESRLPAEVELIHIQATEYFEWLLSSKQTTSRLGLKHLKEAYNPRYESTWQNLMNRKHGELGSWKQFKKIIDWDEISNHLKLLRNAAEVYRRDKNVTHLETSKVLWQSHVKVYGFPAGWQELVNEEILGGIEKTYTPSKFGASVKDAQEDDSDDSPSGEKPENGTKDSGKDGNRNEETKNKQADANSQDLGFLPDAALTVQDNEQKRVVFGWRSCGLGKQLFLVTTPADAPFMLMEIVNGRQWRRTVNSMTSADNDIASHKVDKSFFDDWDFNQLILTGIAKMRRTNKPPGGHANLPEMHIFFNLPGDTPNDYKFAARSVMGSAYGQRFVDQVMRGKFRQGGSRFPTLPQRNHNAIMYMRGERLDDSEDNEDDTESESEADRSIQSPEVSEDVRAALHDVIKPSSRFRQKSGAVPKNLPSKERWAIPKTEIDAELLERHIEELKEKLAQSGIRSTGGEVPESTTKASVEKKSSV